MGGSRGLAAAPEITQTPREEEQSQQAQTINIQLCILQTSSRVQQNNKQNDKM